MAAHEGTVKGLGVGPGVGVEFDEGLEVGLGDSLGEAVAEADGLLCEAAPFVPPHAATASIATTAASLVPTGETNECVGARVTRLGSGVTAHTIKPHGYRAQ
ncbi:MAG TPA: hypothetical protein VEL12_05070 [Candidatus Nitrosopolaris sp.]|nr:hypothetical protein [Candidatus Nitrosopolaris sp.]